MPASLIRSIDLGARDSPHVDRCIVSENFESCAEDIN